MNVSDRVELDHPVVQATHPDEAIALIGVLQELTVAALDLFTPDHTLDPFLQRVAARFNTRVTLCIEGPGAGVPLRLIGSAGLARTSRTLPLPALTDCAALTTVPLPFPETRGAKLSRWVMPVHGGPLGNVSWWLVLVFEREPRIPHKYRGVLERLASTVGVALTHRHLYGLLRERDAELRTLNESLELRVSERTAELAAASHQLESRFEQLRQTQGQLIQAGKMAAVGTLVAGLSHELNNPIAIILGYVQNLLKQAHEGEPGWPALRAIERQAQRCGRLVRSLLDFSRSSPSVREQVALEPLLHRVQELTRGQLRSREVALQLELPLQGLGEMVACSQEIESAVLNLVLNAIDASSPGSSIEVAARAQELDGVAGVQLSVQDHGPGIPAAILPRIFEPFFTTKPVGQGTGLGLSLARQIAESHGGSLVARTVEGEGTTLQLWLPTGGPPPGLAEGS